MTVEPGAGPQGAQGLVLQLTGENTTWSQGTSQVSFPDEPGMVVVSATFASATSGEVVVDIPWSVLQGEKTLRVTTGGEVVEASFVVVAGPQVWLEPGEVERGEAGQVILLRGLGTHFTHPGFAVSINASSGLVGVTLGAVVTDDETAELTLDVGMEATEGHYSGALLVHTDHQDLEIDLEVTPVTGRYIHLVPSAGQQSSSVVLRVQGHKTFFDQSSFSLTFSPNLGGEIEVRGEPVVLSPTVAEAEVWLHGFVLAGERLVTVTDPFGELTASFEVLENPNPPSVVLVPSAAPLRYDGEVWAMGMGTSFEAGLTEVEVICPTPGSPLGFDIDLVLDYSELRLLPRVPIHTPLEVCEVWLHTGPEHVMALFEVQGLPPASISLDPAEGHQGETVTVTITGTGTHFSQAPGETLLQLLGPAAPGVAVTSFVVEDEGRALATLAIGPDAALGPEALVFRVETPAWDEATEAVFGVLPGLPEVTLSPSSVTAGAVGVFIQATGRFTGWVPGETLVTAPGCELGIHDILVAGPESLSFRVSPPLLHAPGPCVIRLEGPETVLEAALEVLPGCWEVPSIPWAFDDALIGEPGCYVLHLAEGDVLRARVTRWVWEALDPEIALHRLGDLSGDPVAWNDDESPATVSSRLVYQVPEAVPYLLFVRDRWGFHMGGFTADLAFYAPEGPSSPDTWEVIPLLAADGNDTPETATSLGDPSAGLYIRARFQGAAGPSDPEGPAEDDLRDWFVFVTPASGLPLALRVLARDLSPFESSTPEVVLRAYLDPAAPPILEMQSGAGHGLDPALLLSGPIFAPGLSIYLEVERLQSSPARTGYWLGLSPWLVINELMLWEDPDPPLGDGYRGAFVELAGPASATTQEPGASLSGCELLLLVDGAVHVAIDLSAHFLTQEGYLVLGRDDSVPGVGPAHIEPGLAFPLGSTGAHAVQLSCGGHITDAVQLTGSASQGGEGAPLGPPALPGTSMGRGFFVDTGDNARDFMEQLEPSPWARNVTEVR